MICFLDDVILPGDVVDVTVAAWYVGVFGGGGRRVSEREGDGVFLRKFCKEISFCVAASLEGMELKVVGGVVGF